VVSINNLILHCACLFIFISHDNAEQTVNAGETKHSLFGKDTACQKATCKTQTEAEGQYILREGNNGVEYYTNAVYIETVTNFGFVVFHPFAARTSNTCLLETWI
jgi:hypothetical protein